MKSLAAVSLGLALGGAAFLGAVQGLTEFLPVSSSGHLVLFQQFFPIGDNHVLFDLVLHLGTLLPVLWFYRSQVWELVRDPFVGKGPMMQRAGVRMSVLLVAASVPTAVIGLVFKDLFEALFATPAILTLPFALTGAILFATRYAKAGTLDVQTMPIWLAIVLGVAQGLAITPGISRSGTTIAVALLFGMKRDFAARFSFLMSVPAIGGAVLLKLRDADLMHLDLPSLGIGFISSMIVGYAALVFLVQLVRRGGLPWFAPYCWLIAVVSGGVAVWQAMG